MTENENKTYSSTIKILIGAAVITFGIVLGGVVYVWAPVSNNEIPVLTALDAPFKSKPDDPGGEKINNKDSKLLQSLDEKTDLTAGGEVLLPPEPAPEPPPIDVDAADIKTEVGTEAEAGAEVETGTKAAEQAIVDDQASSESEAEGAIPTPASRAEEQVEGPLYRVQLAALKNEKRARQQVALLTDKHKTRLGDKKIDVMIYHAGEQGDFWRIITDAMPKSEASKLCDLFKSAGQDCILRLIN